MGDTNKLCTSPSRPVRVPLRGLFGGLDVGARHGCGRSPGTASQGAPFETSLPLPTLSVPSLTVPTKDTSDVQVLGRTPTVTGDLTLLSGLGKWTGTCGRPLNSRPTPHSPRAWSGFGLSSTLFFVLPGTQSRYEVLLNPGLPLPRGPQERSEDHPGHPRSRRPKRLRRRDGFVTQGRTETRNDRHTETRPRNGRDLETKE